MELIEAPGAKPLVPEEMARDRDDHHLLRSRHVGQPAASGGRLCHHCQWRHVVKPTLLHARYGRRQGTRVMSQKSAADAVSMLRQVVTDGTASLGEVPGYEVAGKTGTADKPKPRAAAITRTR